MGDKPRNHHQVIQHDDPYETSFYVWRKDGTRVSRREFHASDEGLALVEEDRVRRQRLLREAAKRMMS